MKNNILTQLEQTAFRSKDKTAYSDSYGSITFGKVEEMAKRIGSALSQRVEPGSAVAVIMGRNIMTPVAFLGIIYAGCFYVPIDAAMPETRLRDIFAVLNPAIVLVDAESVEIIKKMDYSGEYVCTENLLRHDIDEQRLAEIAGRSCLDDPLYVIFTSGSTGRPKGVITSSLALTCYIEAYTAVMEIDENDVLGNQSPLDYIAAVRDIYIPIFTGASMFIIPKDDFVVPAVLFKTLNEQHITAVGWSVSVFTIMVKLGAFDENCPAYLRKICFSGSVMPCSTLRVWQENLPDARFVNQYGPTECTASCTYYVVKDKVGDADVLPIGRPYDNYRVFLLGRDNMPVQQGEIGEICVAGPALALGYYNNRELTEKSFIQNPLNQRYNELIYKTGDYGRLCADGNIEFKGRIDRQIKHLGHRVELTEIDYAALGLQSINEVCAMYHAAKETIYLYYTGTATVKEIAVYLRGKLPGFMIPRKMIRLEEMPRLANGKIDMQVLKNKMLCDN